MAKQKGGLGRGLNSLLGGSPEGNLPQEQPSPVERVVVKDDEKTSKTQVKPTNELDDLAVKRNRPEKESDGGSSNEPYSIKEDNLTIKGVVEREVSPNLAEAAVPPRIKPDKAQETQERVLRATDEVDINLIEPNPDQPRTNFKKEDLEELSESIQQNGLLQPILVRKQGDKYQIIAGERRWQACKIAGVEKVPVRVKEADDDETIMLALIENIQRSDLNPIEEAYGYRRMMERGKMTQTQVAQAVSKGRSTIANALRLLELPEEAQQLLFEEEITAGHARAILSVPTKEGRQKLTEKLMRDKISVRETEAIARLLAGKKEDTKQERPKIPKSYKTVARSLRNVLQADVRVKSVKGKNKIEISFSDEADLERLYRLITAEQ